jgi:WD40 repeat protein
MHEAWRCGRPLKAAKAMLQRFEHANAVTCATVLPGDRLAVTSSNDRTLRLWKLRK